MAGDFILEIGTEEIPSGFIPVALDILKERLKRLLTENRLGFDEIGSMGTPRRLTVFVKGLEEVQRSTRVEVRGPQKRVAYDSKGNPTKALQGFARSQGVGMDAIVVKNTEKGEYVYAIKELKGEKTTVILPGIIGSLLKVELFPKTMRWGVHSITFARPIHWILALYGGEPMEVSYGHIKSGSFTYGHRFLTQDSSSSKPQPLRITGIDDYIETLRHNHVIVDQEERRKIIEEGLYRKAEEVDGRVLRDEGLLDEVVNLVEYPVVLRGTFDREFLELPRDVVINAMREHQRYFSVVDRDNALLPYFLTVANTPARNQQTVIKGNERVLKARLNDARFYFDQDRKRPLRERFVDLKGVIFQARLGTSYEKVERFTELALSIGSAVGFSKEIPHQGVEDFLSNRFDPRHYSTCDDRMWYHSLVLGRASVLSKADLTTGMVGEFPNLQGIMGGIYARLDGEDEEVSKAIEEHYLPTSAGGRLPSSVSASIISIADKLDTIAGCFGVGIIPTGAHDPYALRRQALAIIAIILDKGFRLDLKVAVGKALELLRDKLTRPHDEVEGDVCEFFRERLKNQLLSQGYNYDTVDAVLSTPWYDMVDAVKRIKTLERFKSHPSCSSLVIAFKRVSNILKGIKDISLPERELFEKDQEIALYDVALTVSPRIEQYWKEGNYERLFETLASIKDTVDAFFDNVMVMVDDERIRNNRLSLLNSVRDLYIKIADISKLMV